jgi:hypothetical protein
LAISGLYALSDAEEKPNKEKPIRIFEGIILGIPHGRLLHCLQLCFDMSP